MTIVCLGWGSLIWDPRDLPLDGPWANDGPALSLEFARQSQDGRLTLVLVEHDSPVNTFWAPLAVDTVETAIDALAEREGVARPASIGRIPPWEATQRPRATIAEWAKAKGVQGVVWTDLKPGLIGRRGVVPTLEQLRLYVATLPPETRQRAAHYLAAAPLQIRTPLRSALNSMLA